MTLVEDEVRRAIRAEAAVHQPDSQAMYDRITRTAMRSERAARRSPAPMWVAGAAAAVVALLGGGGLAQWALAGERGPIPEPPAPVVSLASPLPTVTAPGTPSPSVSKKPPASKPATSRPATDSPLWTDGSVDADEGASQGTSVVTVRTTQELSELVVLVRLTRTPELVSRGGSQRVPGASVTSTVSEEQDSLVYRFELSSGDSVPPGTYSFYARYTNADGGRDAGDDAYGVVAKTSGGTELNLTGSF
ncbi:hypothetical protein GCM10010435_50540 [Winogradskya consettensis]|uniref:Uncharacterized protein n=1 Tax=Winogradskya consettensis TaxID=113560 RepID=A0A919SY55_9ACTN|nr:hypothetical protein [Actinoplanes consettensis]GIM80189.1 hypothetical protein Aco04nite_69440 [Actinoplanes consettensis]